MPYNESILHTVGRAMARASANRTPGASFNQSWLQHQANQRANAANVRAGEEHQQNLHLAPQQTNIQRANAVARLLQANTAAQREAFQQGPVPMQRAGQRRIISQLDPNQVDRYMQGGMKYDPSMQADTFGAAVRQASRRAGATSRARANVDLAKRNTIGAMQTRGRPVQPPLAAPPESKGPMIPGFEQASLPAPGASRQGMSEKKQGQRVMNSVLTRVARGQDDGYEVQAQDIRQYANGLMQANPELSYDQAAAIASEHLFEIRGQTGQ